jgi:hypothetical protein
MARISSVGLSAALRNERILHVANLARYFADNFSGSHFEAFCGGGDADAVKNVICAHDLLATTCLSVSFPAHAMLELLEGQVGTGVAEQLEKIPVGKDLHAFSTNPLREGSPAWTAWELIDDLEDVGRTLTSKLLARKRPQLLPVLDDVVVCALSLGSENIWQSVYEFVTEESGNVVEELGEIQNEAAKAVPHISDLSTLRVLDIVVWMEHRSDHYPPKKHKDSLTFRELQVDEN